MGKAGVLTTPAIDESPGGERNVVQVEGVRIRLGPPDAAALVANGDTWNLAERTPLLDGVDDLR